MSVVDKVGYIVCELLNIKSMEVEVLMMSDAP